MVVVDASGWGTKKAKRSGAESRINANSPTLRGWEVGLRKESEVISAQAREAE